ncbi:MAG: hypothetical protein EOP07_24600 [Proteobacteria bacterium]|nr:MAG: hypothetical protein EOP07_24600 [Pseudomonadota bacterium]
MLNLFSQDLDSAKSGSQTFVTGLQTYRKFLGRQIFLRGLIELGANDGKEDSNRRKNSEGYQPGGFISLREQEEAKDKS